MELEGSSGALLRFLENMHPDWNIGLLHYRNHGADDGRMLVGIQVPLHERAIFQLFLGTLGYSHFDEGGNRVAAASSKRAS